MQVPPQPLDAPHIAPDGQLGVQQPDAMQMSPAGHGAVQNPPHPSGVPQVEPIGQLGTHEQL